MLNSVNTISSLRKGPAIQEWQKRDLPRREISSLELEGLRTKFLRTKLLRLQETWISYRERIKKCSEDRKLTVLGPNKPAVKLDEVDTDQEEADRQEKLTHVKLGFQSWPVGRRAMALRCHWCLKYDHIYSHWTQVLQIVRKMQDAFNVKSSSRRNHLITSLDREYEEFSGPPLRKPRSLFLE